MNVDRTRHGKSPQMVLLGIPTSNTQRCTPTLGPDAGRWLTSRCCTFHRNGTSQAIIEVSQWLSHCLACSRGQIRRGTEPRSRGLLGKTSTVPSLPGQWKSLLAPELPPLQGRQAGDRESKMKSILCLKVSAKPQWKELELQGQNTAQFQPQFSHILAVCPWASHFTHLGLIFLNIKWSKLMPTWQDFVRLNQDHTCKARYLAHSRPSINSSQTFTRVCSMGIIKLPSSHCQEDETR